MRIVIYLIVDAMKFSLTCMGTVDGSFTPSCIVPQPTKNGLLWTKRRLKMGSFNGKQIGKMRSKFYKRNKKKLIVIDGQVRFCSSFKPQE